MRHCVLGSSHLQPMKVDGRMNRIFLSMTFQNFSNTGISIFHSNYGELAYCDLSQKWHIRQGPSCGFPQFPDLSYSDFVVWGYMKKFFSKPCDDRCGSRCQKLRDSCMNLYQVWYFLKWTAVYTSVLRSVYSFGQ